MRHAPRSMRDTNSVRDALDEDHEDLTEEVKARRAELEKAPMQAELKHLEKRWTKKGRTYLTEPKEEDDEVAINKKTNWTEKFALCVIRQYDDQNRFILSTALQVNSPALKAILAEVIHHYPGQSFQTTDISVNLPAHCLYHYRPELKVHLPIRSLALRVPLIFSSSSASSRSSSSMPSRKETTFVTKAS